MNSLKYETASFTDKLYEQIAAKGKKSFLCGGNTDAWLNKSDIDSRMSVALVFRPDKYIQSNILDLIKGMRNIDSQLYYYSNTDMHVTVLDILRGEENRKKPDADIISAYLKCIQTVFEQTGPFNISFEGLTYSDSAIMVKGYYTKELEYLRRQLRQNILKSGLALEERYKTKSCHITLARFPDKIQNPLNMLNFIEQNDHLPIGTFTVNKLELVFHNWYDSKKELLGEITL